MIDEQTLQEVVKRIVAAAQPSRVILFGSHAYGEPNRHSDLDLLIVKETSKTPFQRRVEVGRIVQDKRRRTPIQPLVITPRELADHIQRGNPFLIEIVEKGEVLYDAAGVQSVG